MKQPDGALRDLVRQWFEKAESDFSLARHLVAEGCTYRGAIAFNSQQAAEKLLKGFLVLYQIDFPRTHNLGELLDLVAGIDSALAGSLEEITRLSPYGVDYRYPGDFPDLTHEDAEDAFRLAEKTWAAIAPKISGYLKGPV